MANSPAPQGQKAAPAPLPFRVGAQPEDNVDLTLAAVTLTTATQPLTTYHPSAESFLRGVWIEVTATTATNAATTAFQADGPFSVLQSISFTDVQQRFVVGPISGYDLHVINKFGGYFFVNDPRADVNYSATTGSGSTGGSFHFALFLPLEFDLRTGMGTLTNKSTASTFSVNVTLNTIASVYSTAPTNPASVQVTFSQEAYLQPAAADAQGNPLSQAPQAIGSTQYWARSVVGGAGALSSGSFQNIQLSGGLGFPIRNIILEAYDGSNSTRATADANFPSPLLCVYKGVQLFNRTKTLWKSKMGRWYGLTSTTADTAQGLENGIYVQPFILDNTNQPGSAELGYSYLQTNTGTVLAVSGSLGASTTIYELCNWVVPANGNPGSIRAGGR